MISINSNIINVAMFKACNNLFNNLYDLPYALIKGESLSKLAYNLEGARKYQDIDILLSINEVKKAEKILTDNDFEQKSSIRESRILAVSSSHQLPTYKKTFNNLPIKIDLNFDIFWGEYTGKKVNIDSFLDDIVEMNIYGCKVKTLSPLKSMVQLILHHYKEMNSIYHLSGHNCINLNMFKDVYFLWKNNKEEISLKKLYNISSDYVILPYVFYILYFTNQIFNDSDLEKYVEAFKTSEGISLLNYYGLADIERKPWKVDFKTRLETENLYDLIKDDLTESDFEKLERNQKIFG